MELELTEVMVSSVDAVRIEVVRTVRKGARLLQKLGC